MTDRELIEIAEKVEEWCDGRGDLLDPEEAAPVFAEYIGRILSHISWLDRVVDELAAERAWERTKEDDRHRGDLIVDAITGVPPSIQRKEEVKAYFDGFLAGGVGHEYADHPWVGRQTNFNKPLISAWRLGFRNAQIAAETERERQDAVAQNLRLRVGRVTPSEDKA